MQTRNPQEDPDYPKRQDVYWLNGTVKEPYTGSIAVMREVLRIVYADSFDRSYSVMGPWLVEYGSIIGEHGLSDCLSIVEFAKSHPRASWYRDKPFAHCRSPFSLLRSFLRNIERIVDNWRNFATVAPSPARWQPARQTGVSR